MEKTHFLDGVRMRVFLQNAFEEEFLNSSRSIRSPFYVSGCLFVLDIKKSFNSARGLLRILIVEFGRAFGCALKGRGVECGEHLRLALQAVHDDLATFASQRKQSAPLPRPDQIREILIVKLDRVGDMVNTTPVFDKLRERYPFARLDIVGHPSVLSLLKEDPRLGEWFPYKSWLYHVGTMSPPGMAAWKLVRKLSKKRYPLVVYLRGTFPFLLLARHSRFLSAKFVEGEPVIRRYLKAIGESELVEGQMPAPVLHVCDMSRQSVLQKYSYLGSKPAVIIHAMSAAAGKQWPLERFARVADELSVRAQARVLFLASAAEKGKVAYISTLCRYQHDFDITLTLPEVVAAIAQADVFIGNDSGLAHIAAAVGTREVVIWGAANLNMARPIAAPQKCSVLYREVPCRKACPEVRCVAVEYLKCLDSITVEEVIYEALRHLHEVRGEVT